MALSGCGKFLKYSMFIFNIIILIAGAALVGYGVYTKSNQVGILKVTSVLGGNLMITFSLLLIISGSIVIFLSFFGCCGAIKEVRCMLTTFFILLMFIFLGFVISGILAYAFRDKVENYTISQLKKSLVFSYGSDPEVTEAWDSLQNIFQCCGVKGDANSTDSWAFYKTHTDWFLKQSPDSLQYVPESCCKDPENTENRTKCVGQSDKSIAPVVGPRVKFNQRNDQLLTKGCYTALGTFLEGNVKILSGVIAGFAALMILGMVFAVCLCKRLEDNFECEEEELHYQMN